MDVQTMSMYERVFVSESAVEQSASSVDSEYATETKNVLQLLGRRRLRAIEFASEARMHIHTASNELYSVQTNHDACSRYMVQNR